MAIRPVTIHNTGTTVSGIEIRIEGLDLFSGEEVEFFSDISLTQPLKFYRADPQTWWIKSPNLPAGNTTVYAAWNEAGITGGTGDGTEVFHWFDDFDGLSKWNETDTDGVISTTSGLFISDPTTPAWGNHTVYGTTAINRTITEGGENFTPVVGFKHRWTDVGNSTNDSRYNMMGWKDNGAGVSYTDLVYGFYPWHRNTDIYEDGNYQGALNEFGNKWQPTNPDQTWDSEVVTISGGGAIYQSKGEEESEFKIWHESPNSTETPLRPAIVVYNGESEWDHVYVRKHPYKPVKVYSQQDIITIDNDGGALTDHQVMIDSPFFRDKNVEFFTSSGLDTPLSFWREDEETYWVKTNVTASGITNIHFAWGSHLEEKGSGADTFDWFEDWSDGLTGWSYTSTAPTVNELDTMEVQVGSIYPDSSVLSSPQGYMFEARMSPRKTSTGAWTGFMVADTDNIQGNNAGSNGHAMWIFNGSNDDKVLYAGDGTAASYNIVSGGASFTPSDDETYIYGIGWDTTNTYFELDRGNKFSQEYTGTWNDPVYPYFGYFTGSGAGATDARDHRVFWALARKITSNTLTVTVPYPDKYRPVTITNTGGALTDYQVMITDRRLERDISFWDDAQQSNPIPYWREKPGRYWVKVDLPANDDLVIYAFYGNELGDNDGGDGDGVFLFFDDFEDGTISTSKWDLTGGANLGEYDGKFHGGVNNGNNRIVSDMIFTEPVRARTVLRETLGAGNGYTSLGFLYSSTVHYAITAHNSTSYIFYNYSFSNFSFDGSNVREAPGGQPGHWNGKVEDEVFLLGSTSRHIRQDVSSSGKYTSTPLSNTVTDPKLLLGDRARLDNYGQTYVAAWDFVMVTDWSESNTITSTVGPETPAPANTYLGHGFFAEIPDPNNDIGFTFGVPAAPGMNSIVHFPKSQRHATIGIRDITFLKGKGDK